MTNRVAHHTLLLFITFKKILSLFGPRTLKDGSVTAGPEDVRRGEPEGEHGQDPEGKPRRRRQRMNNTANQHVNYAGAESGPIVCMVM